MSKIKWTYEKCKEEALKYLHKSTFCEESPVSYRIVLKNKWIELLSHMVPLGNRYNRLLYVYEFSDNYFYVGLTGNIKRRNIQHISKDINSSVNKHITKTSLTPILIIKSEYIYYKDAIKMEENIYNEYISNKWHPLNVVKTGGIGSSNLKWTFESCEIEALKYCSITDYQTNSPSSYNSALKCGWIDMICQHMSRRKCKNNHWNDKELCRNEALKYSSITELHRNNWSAYSFSKKNGWLYEFYIDKRLDI